MKKNNVNLVRVKLNTDGYFRDSDSFKTWIKPRTFPVIVKAEIIRNNAGAPLFARVPMEECIAIGMNPAIFKGLEECGLNWCMFAEEETGLVEAELL